MLKWQQRSKTHWLKDGDDNTRSLEEREEDIQQILSQYFRLIFTSSRPSDLDMNEVLSVIQPRVTGEMNQALAEPFTADEVKKAVFGMYPLKSPGPDGMPPLFFQKFWRVIGNDVISSALRILNNQVLLHKMNHMHIVLIPKCSNPETVAQLRPISLCNTIVKIASKCIANRLRLLLDSLVSHTQSAFIPGRLITDNVLLAFELNHHLKVSNRLREGYVAFKLDMIGAWHPTGRSTVTISVHFLCRGTIMSNSGCRTTEADCGIAVTAQAPRVSHLLFADDTLVFCEAKVEQLEEIRRILEWYARASGQVVNFGESCMVVSGRVHEGMKQLLAGVLGVGLVGSHDKYLGLPAVGGRSRGELFRGLRDRVWERVQGWSSKLLSQAGRGVLIKAVIQSLPTYVMSCFQLPRVFLKRGLGFRDLQEFNRALLAKQGWRLLCKPEALLSRVLKTKYFAQGSFWTASLGTRPSLTWRSILSARSLLQEGVGGKREIGGDGYGYSGKGGTLQLHIPPRVRLFIWRMCRDAVPTMVWALSNIPWKFVSQWHHGAADWVLTMFQQVPLNIRELFSSICWALWKSRCKKVMEGVVNSTVQTLEHARLTMLQYQEVRRNIRIT
ncbi:UNVERIFIED_CONTAM: hypothetical protein Slati_0691800 [Sesamum latifolium]|uniref:Reverse transcriptase domain-containing protein n=1 Tax=Sesamum latifolium TaxID=2727402 RepID=A0AAW2Y4C3_9LAMI